MSSVYWPLPIRKRASSLRRPDSPMCGGLAKAVSLAPMAFSSRRAGQGGLPLLHGLHDVLVARAAAQVAFELFADLRFGGVGMALAQVQRAHHHARGAETALQAVAFLEGGLHRVQRAIGLGQALDGRDV